MDHVLLDSDVILDFFMDRQPYSTYSEQVLSLCDSKKIKGYLTPVIFSNVYYLLRKSSSHQRAIEQLTNLISITEILVIDKSTILKSLSSGWNDFEDSLQNFSAEGDSSAKVILTRNLKDYRKSNLSILTPEAYLKTRKISK